MKTKALISCAVTSQLICAFVFAYAGYSGSFIQNKHGQNYSKKICSYSTFSSDLFNKEKSKEDHTLDASFVYNYLVMKGVSSWLHRPGLGVIKLFSCSTQVRLILILPTNIKMPTIVSILTFMSWIIYML